MADGSLDNLLELEESFYSEGYDVGLADGHDAGLIEGKIFGVEKGYEKALEMGRLHGRGMVWNERLPKRSPPLKEIKAEGEVSGAHEGFNSQEAPTIETVVTHMESLPDNARLRKHIEVLLNATDGTSIAADNNDDAVADFDERIMRATAKAKVISQIIGESFNPLRNEQTGIEDSKGLSARH
jgi:Essential protein Yae1, N terminal